MSDGKIIGKMTSMGNCSYLVVVEGSKTATRDQLDLWIQHLRRDFDSNSKQENDPKVSAAMGENVLKC
jgi:hypothetical protein